MNETTNSPGVGEVTASLFAAFRPTEVELPARARDLTLGQLRLLFVIRRDGPLTMGRMAEMFAIGQAAATGFAERIERHGFVERRHRVDDRRVVDCHLTAEGEALLDELGGLHRGSLQRSLSRLGPDELAELDRLLRLIAARAT
jgi:DNA-binding MarR family transcriptional regulator